MADFGRVDFKDPTWYQKWRKEQQEAQQREEQQREQREAAQGEFALLSEGWLDLPPLSIPIEGWSKA